MKFSLFVGCNIPARVEQYELSARAVSKNLGIEIADNREFKCCGNPIRNTDHQTFILMAARNIALAEKQGNPLMVLCKCCFGSLKKAAHLIHHDRKLQKEVNDQLAKEDLTVTGRLEIKHFLSVLYHDVGIKAIKDKIAKPYKKLSVATHYGCHALRPSDITQFDNPAAPVLFDDLVKATGAKSVAWPLKLECCGAPLLGIEDALSVDLTQRKLADGVRSGADFLCVACPYCQMQFDRVPQMIPNENREMPELSSLVYPQLLGLAMGMEADALGFHLNFHDIGSIESFLS